MELNFLKPLHFFLALQRTEKNLLTIPLYNNTTNCTRNIIYRMNTQINYSLQSLYITLKHHPKKVSTFFYTIVQAKKIAFLKKGNYPK